VKLPRAVLRSLLGASYHLGGPVVWDRLRRNRAKVFVYHGIPGRTDFEGVENYYGYNNPLTEFEAHLGYLRRRCNLISLQDLMAGRNLASARMNVVLSFDDGYESVYRNAFPLLETHGVPSVMAITTGFVLDREPLWNDVVEYAVQRSAESGVRIPWNGGAHEFSLERPAGRVALYDWLMGECVRVEQERRGELIDLALDELGVSVDAEELLAHEDYSPLTREQVRAMADSGIVELASHSVHHYLLAKLDGKRMRAELAESKERIEELAGAPCTTLALPGGSFDRDVVDEAFRAGYRCVLTSNPGTVERGQRLLKRNWVLRGKDLHWFADAVHGPVFEVLTKFVGRQGQ